MDKITRAWSTILSILMYPGILRQLKEIDSKFIFFFPFYHTGGGEQVHADIMHAIKDQSPVCILTEVSYNEDLKIQFESAAKVVSLLRLGSKRSFKPFMARKIAEILNAKKNLTVFTSNCPLFDLIVPHLNSEIVKIDLIHTYLGHVEGAAEHRTMPYVHLLDRRVVLGEFQKELTSQFYEKQRLDPKLADRITVIPNKAKLVDMKEHRSYPCEVLNVLFVARNSYEKRSRIFVKIAKEIYDRNTPMCFIMIGDFEEFSDQVTPNVKLLGRITDKNQLNSYYNQAHLILITSIFEGFPMVLLEGMSLGVVPISTRVGEVPFHVNEELGTGFIVENDQSEEEIIATFVKKLTYLSENQYVLQEYSRNVKKIVRDRFSEENFNKAYRSLLLNH